jgi:hypothetical protein
MSPGDAPELYTLDVDFPRDRLLVSKNDCHKQDTNILNLWPQFSSKLAMRGIFLRHRGVLLGTVWSSWCQHSQNIQAVIWVSVIKTHWITLATLSGRKPHYKKRRSAPPIPPPSFFKPSPLLQTPRPGPPRYTPPRPPPARIQILPRSSTVSTIMVRVL